MFNEPLTQDEKGARWYVIKRGKKTAIEVSIVGFRTREIEKNFQVILVCNNTFFNVQKCAVAKILD